MDLSKLSYKKDESKQEPETPIRPRVNEGHTDAENISTEVSSYLLMSLQSTKRVIAFVCHHLSLLSLVEKKEKRIS